MENLNESPFRRIRKKKSPDAKPAGLSYRVRDALRGLMGLVAVVVLGLLIWLWYWWATTGTWNALRSQMIDYVELKNGDPMGKVSPVKKLVVVDPRAKDLDPLHYSLPKDLQATRPKEVTTIVQVRRLSDVVGRYTGGGIATQWTFEVAVIDNATKRTLNSRTFKGEMPPMSHLGRKGASASGDPPIREVSDYLAGLAGKTF